MGGRRHRRVEHQVYWLVTAVTMVLRIVLLLCSLMLPGCSQGGAAAPEVTPARSGQYVDGYKKGGEVARAKLKSGQMMLLGFGMPPDWIEQIRVDEFGKLGIAYQSFGHAVDDNTQGYVTGFHEVMAKAVAAKHGSRAIATIQAHIERRLGQEEAKR